MPSTSAFANLYLYDSTLDKTQYFLQFRNDIAGTNTDSNMQKIDRILRTQDDRIGGLETLPHTLTIRATASTQNNFVATGVADFEGFEDKQLFLVYLNQSVIGLSTLSVNGGEAVSMMKVDLSGDIVNLDANDCKINIGYLFQYYASGTRLVLVGETFKEVVVSDTAPTEQQVGGLWVKNNPNGSNDIYYKAPGGTYVVLPTNAQAKFVSFETGESLETFKSTVNTAITSVNDSAVQLTGDQNINGNKTFVNNVYVPTQPTEANHATSKNYVDTNDALNVKLAGNQQITGVIDFLDSPTSNNFPTLDTELVNKAYVDGLDDSNVKTTGDQEIAGAKTFNTPPTIAINPSAALQAANKQYVDSLDVLNVKTSGNQSISGTKTFSSPPVSATNPTAANQVANKQYVDGLDGQNVKITGNQSISGTKTFTSNIVVPATPTANTHATSMQWVNSQLDNKANLAGRPNFTGSISVLNDMLISPFAYSYGADSGILIEATLNIGAMFTVIIYGNGYTTDIPIFTVIQGYSYDLNNTLLSCKQLNLGAKLAAANIYLYTDKLQIWLPNRSQAQTYIVNMFATNKPSGVPLTTTNAIAPTSGYIIKATTTVTNSTLS